MNWEATTPSTASADSWPGEFGHRVSEEASRAGQELGSELQVVFALRYRVSDRPALTGPVGEERTDQPEDESRTDDDADLSKGEARRGAGPAISLPARQGCREDAEHLDCQSDDAKDLTSETFVHREWRVMSGEWQVIRGIWRLVSSQWLVNTVGIPSRVRFSSRSPLPARHSVTRHSDQIAGSSKPLRGSRGEQGVASGSFLIVSVSVSHSSLRPTL